MGPRRPSPMPEVWPTSGRPCYAAAMHTAPFAPSWPLGRRLVLMLSLAAAAACGGSAPVGQGLGRPDFVGRSPSAPLGITLLRMAPPGPSRTAPAFVQLYNGGSAAIDTSVRRLWLQTTTGSITLPQALWAPGTTLTVSGAQLDPLELHSTAGELIVLGEDLALEAYAAWGADPATLPGGLHRLARSQGLPVSWQPLPYPVDGDAAINLASDANRAPCVADDLAAVPPLAAAACQKSPGLAQLYLSRIQPSGLDNTGSSVELYNPGPQALDLTAVQLCVRGSCHPIVPLNQNPNAHDETWLPAPTGAPLTQGAPDPSRRRIVLLGGIAQSSYDLITSIPSVASRDEVALLAPGATWAEAASALLSFVRLSPQPASLPGPTALADAAPAGVQKLAAWRGITLQAPVLAGETLALKVLDANAPFGPAAWTLDASAYGTALQDRSSPYNACSAPQSPKGRAPLTISQITAQGDQGVVFLYNASDAALPLRDYSLAQGPNQTISLATATLSNGAPMLMVQPKELVRIALSADMQCLEPYNVCWSNPSVALAEGELTVLQGNAPVAHVQWGTTSLASAFGDEAAAAGLWPLARCRVAAFTGEEDDLASLVLLPGRAGVSPADFALGGQAVGADIYVANP